MEDKLKIVMTADTVGGVWTYALDLCKALMSYNVEVHLVTMGALLNEKQSIDVNKLSNTHVYQSNYKLEWTQGASSDMGLAKKWIASICLEVDPDIIHFNNYNQSPGSWKCPVITVYHSCEQTCWRAVKGSHASSEWNEHSQTVKEALITSDIVVAPTKSILKEAEAIYGKLPNSEVIYNGRNINRPFGEQQKEPIILSAGRVWDEAKNIQLLSSIAREVEWPIWVAGNNSKTFRTGSTGLDTINFLDLLSPDVLQQWMDQSAIFIMPAKYEPFGLAILEAAQSSCVLVLSNLDTLKEIWGDAALYFDPFKEEQAKDLLNELANNDELRHEMAKRAYKRASEFTAESMAYNYMRLYKKLLVVA
ncbi:glycosyl transferase [Marivirga lumbricoides]|uniref:Glycosyl transferase n=1 Tax=Marivirga lumbricoides TaxID=1046115 RepID=A0ABQ1M829_9BACT|nr:glycosyl transferase [Marivirga lumbricoides]